MGVFVIVMVRVVELCGLLVDVIGSDIDAGYVWCANCWVEWVGVVVCFMCLNVFDFVDLKGDYDLVFIS